VVAILVRKEVIIVEDNIFTTLSSELSTDELEDYNDVPLTSTELEELYALEEDQIKNKLEEQNLIKSVLENAGVNLYEQEYQLYC